MWQKTYEEDKAWQAALSYCENLDYAGYTDWRLPNKDELMTLVNYDKYSPASNFPGMTANRFWTSTSRSNYPERAFNIWLSTGRIDTRHKTDYSYYVKCVRGGN